MATLEDYLKRSVDERVARLRQTPGEITADIQGHPATALGRRPDAQSWCPTEIICHLRDVEELFQTRFHTILGLEDPTIFVFGAPPETHTAWGVGGAVTHPL